MAGVRVVKGFGAEPVQAESSRSRPTTSPTRSMRARWIRARYLPAMEIAPNIGLITVLGYGGHLVLDGP